MQDIPSKQRCGKRLVREQEQWLLKPENPNYPTIPLQAELELVIWGAVTRVIHNL